MVDVLSVSGECCTMGVPMTNLTLTELLPRSNLGNVDELASLSAGDLIALLENLRVRSEGIKEKVHKTLSTYKKEFDDIITQSNQIVGNVDSVRRELKNVLELLGEKEIAVVNQGSSSISPYGVCNPIKTIDRGYIADYGEKAERSTGPVDLEICQLAAQVQRLRSKIKEREEALVVLKTICSLHDLLTATKKKFLPSNLVGAAQAMVTLQEKLGLNDSVEVQVYQGQHHDVRAFRLLQDAWSAQYNKLVDLLEALVSKAIVLDERRSELVVTPYILCKTVEVGTLSDTVELSSIFTAMDVLGALDVRLAKVGDVVVRSILGPLLKNSEITISTLVPASGAESTSSSILRWSLGTQWHLQNTEAVPKILYPKIVQIIKFLHDHIFHGHDERLGRFGRVLWPRLAEAIIGGCLSKAVPNETSQLKDFEKIADLTASFEKDLAREGLISNFDQTRGDKLSTFTSDVEVHFALKRKKQVLAKARDLLMQSNYSPSASTWKSFNDQEYDKDLDRSIYLHPEPCAISLLARSLLEIVHEALEDACLSTPRTAMELYHGSRDVLLLYRAIIPVKLGTKLDRMQVAALCHNDCLYIAYDLLTFFYQYYQELPPCLKQVFTFIDLVPLFQQMAEEVLDQVMEGVRREIMQGLDHANGFQYTDQQKHFELAQEALEEVFQTLANVRLQLGPILGHSVYKKVVGGLISLVVGRIISDVTAINDIAVEETIQLQSLLLIVQDRLPPFLSPAVEDVAEKREMEEHVEMLVPLWHKLETLIDLLDMSLVSINQAWESGDLSSCGFSPAEVQKIVRAIFSETALRGEFLRRLGSA